MIEGVRERALAAGIIDAEAFDLGVRDLYRTAEADGIFCYTFFKGVGAKAHASPPKGADRMAKKSRGGRMLAAKTRAAKKAGGKGRVKKRKVGRKIMKT